MGNFAWSQQFQKTIATMHNIYAYYIYNVFMDKTLKTLLFILYPLIAVCMAAATIIEKYKGTPYVGSHIYGSWWFSLLWAALLVCGVAWLVRRKVRQWPLLLLHGGLAVVLVGAFVTHLWHWQGTLKLRCGTSGSEVQITDGRGKGTVRTLPFTVRLDNFDVKTHAGSDDAADYISHLTITDAGGSASYNVMMNHTVTYRHIKIMQSGYDSDRLGSILAVSSDPVGTPLTYLGYALLFVGVTAMLFHRKSTFRRLLHSPLLRDGAFAALLLLSLPGAARAAAPATPLPPTIGQAQAKELGRLLIMDNGRVCPLQTYALAFTRKLCGSSTYRGLSAEQVLAGWMFWPDQWANEPMIKTGRQLQSVLMLPARNPFNRFFDNAMGGYILGPYIREYYSGQNDKFHADAAAVDERLQLITSVRNAQSLALFPISHKGSVRWFSPADELPAYTARGHRLFIANALPVLQSCAVSGDEAGFHLLVSKTAALQQRDGGQSLPSRTQLQAELVYNALPFNTILFMLNLAMGFVLLFAGLARTGRSGSRRSTVLVLSSGTRHGCCDSLLSQWCRSHLHRIVHLLPAVVMGVSFAVLTFFGALRWIISGTVPMSNGFETMLFVAWAVMLVSLLCARRLPIVLTFGFLMSGFFLLVSHISQMDPQISHVMPVLNSPLLSVHVSIIMTAFALLSITFICAVTALLAALRLHMAHGRNSGGSGMGNSGGMYNGGSVRLMERYAVLSRIFLYPAITFLTIGIFVGAIWAERSWGTYWGWDPKETWALITLMVYAVPLHTATVGSLRRPIAYHVYMALAFLAIVMTYFGVNYFLGGMHSYA